MVCNHCFLNIYGRSVGCTQVRTSLPRSQPPWERKAACVQGCRFACAFPVISDLAGQEKATQRAGGGGMQVQQAGEGQYCTNICVPNLNHNLASLSLCGHGGNIKSELILKVP